MTVWATLSEARGGRRRGPQARRHSRSVHHARPGLGVLIALGLWVLVAHSGVVSREDLPLLSDVARALVAQARPLLASASTTILDLFIGLVIAAALGAIAGTLVGRSRTADEFADMIVRIARPMPAVALIPVAILLAGLSTTMTSGLVAFAAFWPVFINARYSARSIEPLTLDTGHVLGLSRTELALRVIVPRVAPDVFTGIRIAAGVATVATISVELIAGTGGLGGYVLTAEESGAISHLYAGVLVGGFVGWVISFLLSAFGGRAFAWADHAGAAAGR